MLVFLIVNYFATEWKRKFIKEKSRKDQGQSQKAIDSLINFETVKYFNGEDHERNRYFKSLLEYKDAEVTVAQSQAVFSLVTGTITFTAITLQIFFAYYQILEDKISIGDFMVI